MKPEELTMKYQIIYADPPWAYLWGTEKKAHANERTPRKVPNVF